MARTASAPEWRPTPALDSARRGRPTPTASSATHGTPDGGSRALRMPPTRSSRSPARGRASRSKCTSPSTAPRSARGHTEPGERCEIRGLGPAPVTTARALLDDARVSVLVRDGDDVTAVSSPKRTIPAKLRRALEARYPTCGVKAAPTTSSSRSTTSCPSKTAAGPSSPTRGGSAPTTTSSRPTEAGRSSANPATGTSSHPTTPTRREGARLREGARDSENEASSGGCSRAKPFGRGSGYALIFLRRPWW